MTPRRRRRARKSRFVVDQPVAGSTPKPIIERSGRYWRAITAMPPQKAIASTRPRPQHGVAASYRDLPLMRSHIGASRRFGARLARYFAGDALMIFRDAGGGWGIFGVFCRYGEAKRDGWRGRGFGCD